MTFYRIGDVVTKQGLWYNQKGEFTGLIHNKFNFCANCELPMDYDEEIVGFLSAATSLEELYKWFPKEDILKLQEFGYEVEVYESENYKFYDKYQHHVIHQEKSKLVETFKLLIQE